MKKTQRLTAVFLLLLILCGCSTPTAPDTIVMPQTSAETRTEPAPVSAEPEPGVFHLEYEQTALPEPLSAVTALTVLDGTFLLGGVSETGLALVRLTAEGKAKNSRFRAARSISTRSARMGQAGRGCSAEACRRAISMRSETSGSFQRSRRASLRWPTMTPRSPCRRSCSCRRSTPTAFSSCAGLKAAFA